MALLQNSDHAKELLEIIEDYNTIVHPETAPLIDYEYQWLTKIGRHDRCRGVKKYQWYTDLSCYAAENNVPRMLFILARDYHLNDKGTILESLNYQANDKRIYAINFLAPLFLAASLCSGLMDIIQFGLALKEVDVSYFRLAFYIIGFVFTMLASPLYSMLSFAKKKEAANCLILAVFVYRVAASIVIWILYALGQGYILFSISAAIYCFIELLFVIALHVWKPRIPSLIADYKF